MRTKIFLLGAVFLFALIGFVYLNLLKEYGKSIHIAFVGPMSGEGAAAGRLMTQAIELHFNKINQRGGISGREIILKVFDDQNDAKKAQQKAQEIIDQDQALAVIGHWYSSASISAGKVYKNKIPAITPGSTSIKVTLGNEWYFRNIYNAKAASQFLVNYVKNVFKQEQVSIIQEGAAYGSYLAEVFEQESLRQGMEVKNQWRYDNDDDNLEKVFEKIVAELKSVQKKAGVIFLAVQAIEGVKLVKLIKDAGIPNIIIGSSSFSEQTFRNGFDKFLIEKKHPGFYINDIYVATPLIFDTANEKAQQFKDLYKSKYDEEPDWSAAFAYDTAIVLTEAISRAQIEGSPKSLTEDRQKIRDALAKINHVDEAVEGVTGLNYFNDNRDAQKPVSLGVYKQKNSVSALTQLQTVHYPNEIADLKQAQQQKRILLINDKYMYKTNVVYVGLKIIRITDIDVKNLRFYLDCKLWFRFQGIHGDDFHPENIEFLNVSDHEKISTQLQNPIKKKIQDKITYLVYRITGHFQADFLEKFYAYKKHIIGISFRHKTLTRNNLIYVTDVVGMGLAKKEFLAKRLARNRVVNPTEGWTINNAWFYPDIIKEYSSGDPDYLNMPGGTVEYSRFNAVLRIQKDQLTLRGKMPYKIAKYIMIFSGIIFLILTFLGANKQQKFSRLSKLIWFFQVIFAFLWLLSGEIIFADWLAERTDMYQLEYIIKIFDILWWLIPAFLLNVASERFIWTPLEKQVGPLPNIIRHFFALLVYIMASLGIVVFVYEQRFTSLLATSSVLAMIIGLAVQINISNMFSGIVINMDRPFRIGDWTKIGTFDEGEVVDINWRATRLKARNGCILSIPNSRASESVIINFHYPDNVYWLWPTVYVHPRHNPVRVKKILLDALLSANTILKDPEPVILLTGINEWAASYWVAFCADSYASKYFILEDVWTRIWFHLNRAEIAPAVMRQEIHLFKGDSEIWSHKKIEN